MDMSSSQAKFIELTMKLDLKAREYKKINEKFEQCKSSDENDNEEKLYNLLEEFKANNKEVITIRNELNNLQKSNIDNSTMGNTAIKMEEHMEGINMNEYSSKSYEDITTEQYSDKMLAKTNHDSWWIKIKNKIMKIFGK